MANRILFVSFGEKIEHFLIWEAMQETSCQRNSKIVIGSMGK